jgi:hypothetical protein
MPREKKPLSEVIQEKHPEFASSVEKMSTVDLEKKLSYLSKANEANEDAKEEDMDNVEDDKSLGYASALRAGRIAPYNDLKKDLRLMSRYVISLIKEKGGNV